MIITIKGKLLESATFPFISLISISKHKDMRVTGHLVTSQVMKTKKLNNYISSCLPCPAWVFIFILIEK